ncbi:MAG: hypothetical protein AB2712_08360 [Candidatus Thiodiazotropha sp.]
MDLAVAAKLFAPVLKDLLKKDNIDLSKELDSIKRLHPGLCYVILQVNEFVANYFGDEDIEKIQNNQEQFVNDYLAILSLTTNAQFIFNQAYLGHLVKKAFESLDTELKRLLDSVLNEANYNERLKAQDEGRYIRLSDVKSSVLRDMAIIEAQRDFWSVLIANQRSNNSTRIVRRNNAGSADNGSDDSKENSSGAE